MGSGGQPRSDQIYIYIYLSIYLYAYIAPMLQNQMEKKREHAMESGLI